MKNKLIYGIAAIGIAALLVSCEKAPQAEIDLTKASVDSALLSGAAVYQSEELAMLEDSMAAVMERIEAENGKMFPSYSDLKTELESVKAYAGQVVQKTEARKAEVQQEIQTVLAEVKTLIEENKTLIAQAPKGKEGKEALEQINAELTGIETSVAETNELVTKTEYIQALDKSKLAKENAMAINNELKEVIAKTSKKPARG